MYSGILPRIPTGSSLGESNSKTAISSSVTVVVGRNVMAMGL